MKKFKIFLTFTIIFSIFMFIGMLGLVITFNPDSVISYYDVITEIGAKLNIETIEECQTYLMLYIVASFIVQVIFLVLTIVTGKKLSETGAADSTVEVVTEKALKKLKKNADKAKSVIEKSISETSGETIKEKSNSFLNKLKGNAKEAIVEESKEEVAAVETQVKAKVESAKEKQIDDILNSLR